MFNVYIAKLDFNKMHICLFAKVAARQNAHYLALLQKLGRDKMRIK